MKRLALLLICAVFLFPLYWMVAGSFMAIDRLIALPPRLVPWPIDISSYKVLFLWPYNLQLDSWAQSQAVDWVKWIANTGTLVAAAAFLAVFVDFSAAYWMVYLGHRGRKVIYWIFMVSIMLPGNLLFVARFVVFRMLGLTQDLMGLVVVYAFSPFQLFLVRHYMDTIPTSLRDMALVDGCGEFRAMYRIILPICAPAMGVVVMFTSMAVLGDYLWQLMLTESGPRETMLVGLMRIVKAVIGMYPDHHRAISISLAAGTLLLLPVVGVFLVSQRYFKEGLTVGAIRD